LFLRLLPADLGALGSVALNTFYVSTSGSDSNLGTVNQPLRTITHAANLAAPGDTVVVRGGTYNQAVTISTNGTSGAPITFQPYNGEHVTIDGSGLSSSTNSLVNIYANYIKFQGFEVANSPGHGLSAWATHDVSILNNNVHDGRTTAIYVGGDSIGQSHDNLIQGNSVYNNVLSNQTRNGTWERESKQSYRITRR
jgi:hypothetical protein